MIKILVLIISELQNRIPTRTDPNYTGTYSFEQLDSDPHVKFFCDFEKDIKKTKQRKDIKKHKQSESRSFWSIFTHINFFLRWRV